MANTEVRRKVEKSLRYRWGVIGLVLVAGLSFYYLKDKIGMTSDIKQMQDDWAKQYVKIVCPRCNADPTKIKTCSLCNGLGYIWLDKTREDIPEEIVVPKTPASDK